MSDKIDKIKPISSTTKASILRKTAYALPLRPSESGMSAEDIKKAFYSGMTDKEDSVMAELERVISEANIAFQSFEENKQESNLGVDNPNKVLITNAQGDIITADKDITPTANSDNLITSGGVHAYPAIKFAESERQKSKNLLQVKNGLFQTSYGVTINIDENDVITVDGNATHTTAINITRFFPKIEKGKSYTLSFYNYSNLSNFSIATTAYKDDTSTLNNILNLTPGITTITRTFDDNYELKIEVYVENSETPTGSFKIMLEQSDTKSEEYQSYHGQTSHTGDKEIAFARNEYEKSKNLFFMYGTEKTIVDVTFNINEASQILTINGTSTAADEGRISFIKPITCKAGKTYTFKAHILSGNTQISSFALYDTNRGLYIDVFGIGSSGNYISTKTFTEDITFNALRLYIPGSGNISNDCNMVFQLEEGSVATGYQPYNGAIVHEKEITPDLIYDKDTKNIINGIAYTDGIKIGTIIPLNYLQYKKIRVYSTRNEQHLTSEADISNNAYIDFGNLVMNYVTSYTIFHEFRLTNNTFEFHNGGYQYVEDTYQRAYNDSEMQLNKIYKIEGVK